MSFEEKISDYIEILNDESKGLIPKNNEKNIKFADGTLIGTLWRNHSKEIIEELKNPKYDVGYELAKKKVEAKKKELDKQSVSIEEKISDYIEILNDESKGLIPGSDEKNITFGDDGSLIRQFWRVHEEKIIEELKNPKYDVGYEIAKLKVKGELFYKISKYIDLLNNEKIGLIPTKEEKNITFWNGGLLIGQFWGNHKEEIINELETNPKYDVGYELAKKKVEVKKKAEDKNKEIIKLSVEEKISKYIDLLNDEKIGLIPSVYEKNITFWKGGPLIRQFWNHHKEKIIKELNTNTKYTDGYEIAKLKVKGELFYKISKYIYLLNNEKIALIPKTEEKNITFWDGGPLIGRFWNHHKEEIINELETNPKYDVGYEIAKKKIKRYLCSVSIRKEREKKKKLKIDFTNINEDIDIDYSMLNTYLLKYYNSNTNRTMFFMTGETLKKYCLRNGFNYNSIYYYSKKLMAEKGLPFTQCVADVIDFYKKNGQSSPNVWIYSKNEQLLKQILLDLHIDSNSVIKNMKEIDITLPEAIASEVFKRNSKDDEKWMEELFYFIVDEIDSNKTNEEQQSDIVEMFNILRETYDLDNNELVFLYNMIEKYVGIMEDYYIYDVGLTNDQTEKISKIKRYGLDDDAITESYFVRLKFDLDKKVLLPKESFVYKRNEDLRLDIIDWNDYTDEEKEKIINEKKYTLDEINFINAMRLSIDNMLNLIHSSATLK